MFGSGRGIISSTKSMRKYLDGGGKRNSIGFKFLNFRHKFWSVISGSRILPGVRLGERLSLPHTVGLVFHEDAVIGTDCMIMQGVTLGQTSKPGAPCLGNHVYVGAGAKVLGSITIGDRARIGANAVVLIDVPAGSTAVGVPARIVSRTVRALTRRSGKNGMKARLERLAI